MSMQPSLFELDSKTIENMINPDTYKGIYSFHKYWGKKPVEGMSYFIQHFTNEHDIVLDPFLGSGLISLECLQQNRNFIGIDINPFSIEHTKFLLNLPSAKDYISAIRKIEISIKEKINNSYKLENGGVASHYLWDGANLSQVWTKSGESRNRLKLNPTVFDFANIESYSEYRVKNIRDAVFFTNSRINSNPSMSIYDFFTRRALYNMDLLIDEIKKIDTNVQRALYLTLTSAAGQMSSMVFAITGRGKTKNKKADKIEVGSWVIGLWRPELHFEINVWNCFENRAKKLYKTLLEMPKENSVIYDSVADLLRDDGISASIINKNCLDVIKEIPDNSIKLLCTDPPHSDRIPYLELSEIWNSILNKEVHFEDEIIISNAKERNKTKESYLDDMSSFMSESSRVLKQDGLFLLYFNARDKESWKFMEYTKSSDLVFECAFYSQYSATSVVQDNRKGGMKTDYIIVMKHKNANIDCSEFKTIPSWTSTLPQALSK